MENAHLSPSSTAQNPTALLPTQDETSVVDMADSMMDYADLRQ
jgi:hypothetical protein